MLSGQTLTFPTSSRKDSANECLSSFCNLRGPSKALFSCTLRFIDVISNLTVTTGEHMKDVVAALNHLFWSLDEHRRRRKAKRLPISHLVIVEESDKDRISPEMWGGLMANQRGMMTLPELAAWLRRSEISAASTVE